MPTLLIIKREYYRKWLNSYKGENSTKKLMSNPKYKSGYQLYLK